MVLSRGGVGGRGSQGVEPVVHHGGGLSGVLRDDGEVVARDDGLGVRQRPVGAPVLGDGRCLGVTGDAVPGRRNSVGAVIGSGVQPRNSLR
ncbi:hypothetical protein SANTM175S_09345 [Streptomyces antimycoticus]